MKKLLVWVITASMFFAVIGCEKEPEKKKRPLLPTEKAWIDSHPDGELRDGPEDFEEFAIKDRCDPTLDVPWRWRKVVIPKNPNEDLSNNFKPETNNLIPVAVMELKLVEDTKFKLSALKSYDEDDGRLNFEWLINYKYLSNEPELEVVLEREMVYKITLNVWNMNNGNNQYKMGSTVSFMLDVDKVTCPEK